MDTLERIVALKEKLYKTDAEFERAAGISPKMYDKWKKRGAKSYRKHIVNVARALNTTSAYLLCETDEAVPQTRHGIEKEDNTMSDKSTGDTLNPDEFLEMIISVPGWEDFVKRNPDIEMLVDFAASNLEVTNEEIGHLKLNEFLATLRDMVSAEDGLSTTKKDPEFVTKKEFNNLNDKMDMLIGMVSQLSKGGTGTDDN